VNICDHENISVIHCEEQMNLRKLQSIQRQLNNREGIHRLSYSANLHYVERRYVTSL